MTFFFLSVSISIRHTAIQAQKSVQKFWTLKYHMNTVVPIQSSLSQPLRQSLYLLPCQ